ncbi:MAG: hypothetical protein LBV34_25595, partial [Nocardiopsaceae bacterium]|nr:hypothetical protein [Nocardiopsaceae bacterium]
MQTADVVVSDPTGEPVPACPEATITWTDPVTGKSGYLVIDRLVRGVASGGMRMREGCTFDEVRRLAASMSLKEALHYVPGAQYLPLGGAKGGLDCDPASPEAPGVLYRFFAFIKPYLETHWATGDDLGTSAAVIDDTLARLGVDGCIGPALALTDDPDAARERFEKAQAIDVGGIGLGELVGGCGVAEAALTALDRGGLDRTAATAVV